MSGWLLFGLICKLPLIWISLRKVNRWMWIPNGKEKRRRKDRAEENNKQTTSSLGWIPWLVMSLLSFYFANISYLVTMDEKYTERSPLATGIIEINLGLGYMASSSAQTLMKPKLL